VSVEARPPTKIYTPASLNELLAYYRDHPKAILFAGGTYLIRSSGPRMSSGGELIDLGRVPDFAHISRTERYMEIGPAVPISKIMATGRHVMPRALYTALGTIGGMALRNHATLGGNICARDHRLSAYPVLLLLDVRLELRRSGSSRWINLNRFISSKGVPVLETGELLTRIRIPFLHWDIEEFRNQGRIFSPDHFIFCGVAKKQKEVVSDLRTSFCIASNQVIRARSVESELIGRKLPLPADDRREMSLLLQHQLERNHPELDAFHRDRIRRSLSWFLRVMNDSV
jgi:xanthine dehydrogenase small subunit